MRKSKSTKIRVPRKLKKAAKGVVRQIRKTQFSHVEGNKFICDEWVGFAIIGRNTKPKRKLIKLAIREEKLMRAEMLRRNFEEFKNYKSRT